MFLGRVRRRENYKFWRYASGLMAGGVLSAKDMQEEKRGRSQRPRRFSPPWFRARMPAGEVRKSGPLQDELAKKISAYSKVPRSYALFFVVPFLPLFFKDDRKAEELTASLHLDVPQITFLLGDTNKEKAKSLYEAATKVTTERAEAPVTRIARSAKPDVKEEKEDQEKKRVKTREAEIEEKSEREEEEQEPKDQKTLTDFF